MSNIVPIDSTATQYDEKEMSEASKDCAVMLRKWLDMAEAGQIVSVCLVGINKDTSTYRYGISTKQEAIGLMVGGLERVKYRLHQDID